MIKSETGASPGDPAPAGQTQHSPDPTTTSTAALDAATDAQQLALRLAQSTADLAYARRELDAFTYAVAHDLRAPLRLIDAHAQMLREYTGITQAREPQIHLEQIRRGAQQMSALIDGILMLSRLSCTPLAPAPTPLDALVTQALAQIRPATQGRRIDWRIGVLPSVNCDPALLLQVFVNLLDNAVKFSRTKTQACIEIGIGGEVERHVFVRDNGVGFDMRYAGKLFGAFQRLHRHDEFEGDGVGLAAASCIIERHGGVLTAQGAPGEGAMFCFTLPGLI